MLDLWRQLGATNDNLVARIDALSHLEPAGRMQPAQLRDARRGAPLIPGMIRPATGFGEHLTQF